LHRYPRDHGIFFSEGGDQFPPNGYFPFERPLIAFKEGGDSYRKNQQGAFQCFRSDLFRQRYTEVDDENDIQVIILFCHIFHNGL
jgi:hypothetical protein